MKKYNMQDSFTMRYKINKEVDKKDIIQEVN